MGPTDSGIRELELLLDSMLLRIEFLEKEVERLKQMHSRDGTSVHPTVFSEPRRYG